jgi:DNA polymerase-1
VKISPVYIVDAMNYIFRAYHALPPMSAPSGMPTNAVLGYARTLLRIVKEQKPRYLVAAFDADTSFRTQLFKGYKANRKEMPAGLIPQVAYCRKITAALGIPIFEAVDFEADDVIGTVAVKMLSLGYPAVIVTGDKDLSQLVCNDICVYDIAKASWIDEAAVRQRYGVAPKQIPDLLALHGDSVDNIPGVPGVGPQTARQILSVFQSVDEIDKAAPAGHPTLAVRGGEKLLQRIRDTMDSVRLSRRLATVCCDVPVPVDPETVRYRQGETEELTTLCQELGMSNILAEIPWAQPRLF